MKTRIQSYLTAQPPPPFFQQTFSIIQNQMVLKMFQLNDHGLFVEIKVSTLIVLICSIDHLFVLLPKIPKSPSIYCSGLATREACAEFEGRGEAEPITLLRGVHDQIYLRDVQRCPGVRVDFCLLNSMEKSYARPQTGQQRLKPCLMLVCGLIEAELHRDHSSMDLSASSSLAKHYAWFLRSPCKIQIVSNASVSGGLARIFSLTS